MAVHAACGGVLQPDVDGIDSRIESAYPCECGDCPLCGELIDGETVELWGTARGHSNCAESAWMRQQEGRA